MESRPTLLPARALVWDDGSIEELDDSRGAQLLNERPELLRYASALPATGRPHALFAWSQRRGPWLLVRLSWVSPRADGSMAVMVELDRRDPPPFGLTSRELDVLTLMAGGLSNPEIAARLYASRGTISTHVENLLAKLGQRGRTGAAAVAIEQGLLRLPIPGGPEGFEHLVVGALELASSETVPHNPAHAALAARVIRVGLVAPVGGVAGDRTELLNGSQLAIEEINEHGGVTGRALEQVVSDVDIADVESIKTGLTALADAEVDIVTLGYMWVEDPAIYEPALEYGCPILTAMTSEAQAQWVTDRPEQLGRVFQVGSTERAYGVGFFRLLDELVRKGQWKPANHRMLCIQTDVAAGQFLDDRALALAADIGWEVQQIVIVAHEDADWSDALAAIRSTSPAAVLVGHFVPAEVARFQREFIQDPRDALIYCVYAPSVPEYQEATGDAAEGVVWTTVTGTYSDSIGRAFLERYESRFGRKPGRAMAGIAYDQVHLAASAWAHAGNPRAFDRVADELRSLVHRGVSGVYALGNARQTGLSYPDETADPSIGLAALIFQIQDGDSCIISPAPYEETDFRLPAWFRSRE